MKMKREAPMYRYLLLGLSLSTLILTGCQQSASKDTGQQAKPRTNLSEEFKNYWYSGKAEVSRYQLTQSRYGQANEGEAVMVFVTEDFLPEKQVKHEANPGLDDTKVLKLNKIKRFQTGMYDYSMMMSVFSPVHRKQYPHALKVTSSSQDWCGQSYLQVNNRDGTYQWDSRSYFQDMVKETYETDTTWLEDELWTRLKQDPESLPTGEVAVIPGTFFKWLRHRKLEPETANITQKSYSGDRFKGDDLMRYRIRYPEIERTLTIVYESSFPHMIKGWTDRHKSGFGPNEQMRTTVARHQKTIRNAYWTKNSLKDSTIRKDLNLPEF